MKKWIQLSLVGIFIVMLVSNNSFAFDFEKFARKEVLRCMHPTVDLNKAAAALIGEPKREDGGITRAKVKIDYHGWMRNNSMTVEISIRESNPKMVRVSVLNDSSGISKVGCVVQSCSYVEGWQEIPD